jgi:signal peptidase I
MAVWEGFLWSGRRRKLERKTQRPAVLNGKMGRRAKGMKHVVKEIFSTIFYILLVLFGTWVLITFVGQRTSVSGSSMEPTLHHGDQLILDKLSYHFSEPERFDIIVFPFQYEEKTYYVKRIIGLPGETVQIDLSGNIYINGEILEEDYGLEPINFPGLAQEPITLGEDEYFVLGDNRNNSSDSRDPSVGNIKRDDIMGKAWVRIWPLNKFGVLKHQ